MKTRLFFFGRLATLLLLAMMTVTGAKADVIPATKADVGKVVCSDGSIYATVSAATAAGKTAQAMICYVDDEQGIGLGISLEDGPISEADKIVDDEGCRHNAALRIASDFNTTHPIEGGTWRLPSVNDWEHMFIGSGSTSTYVDKLPDPSWSSDPYAISPYEFLPGNIRSMVVAAGGTDFTVQRNVYPGYWSSTGSATTGGMWWDYFFDFSDGSIEPVHCFELEVKGLVRPCVEFQVPISHEYFTLTLNQSKMLAPFGKTTTLTATLTPLNDYNKNVVWTTSNGNVQLFADAECTKAVENTPTEVHTVYVKGVAEGAVTVTVTSDVNTERTASCEMTAKDICIVKFKDGTEDADRWSITYYESNFVYAILDYSGNKKIKSVTLVKSGETGSYTNPRKTKWVVGLPELDEDEIEVEYYPTLADNEDNSVAIDAMNGKTQETLVLNTVIPLGWYVFTAPFDIPAQTAKQWCAFDEVREFVGSSYFAGGGAEYPSTIKLFFDVVTDIKAGVPYLVKTAMDRDLFTYPFSNVTVSNISKTVVSKYAYFTPTLSRTLVTDDPQNILFAESPAIKNNNPPYDATYYVPVPYHPEAPAWIKGFSGYFWLTPEVEKVFPNGGSRIEIVFGPYVPEAAEPVTEEVTEKPSDTAKPGEVTTSESGITTVLSEDDTVDPEEGSVTMHTQLTTNDILTLLDIYAPGSSAFFDTYKGIYFLLSAGKGKVEIEMETLGDVLLSVIQGTVPVGTYKAGTKGTVTIEYNVEQDTWFFAFPVVEASSEAPARGNRASAAEDALKIYSVKVIPNGETTGIEHIRTDLTGNGYIYNVQGQRVTMPKKGLYIIDGRKLVVK